MTFLYISFPIQYHALNTVFRLFHSYSGISNIFSYDGVKIFRHLRKSSSMVKVPKYSIKSGFTCALYKSCSEELKMSQNNTFAWVSFQKTLQAYSLELFLKKVSVHVFSCKFCQIFQSTLLEKHVRLTPSAKYPFVCHINLSHKMLPLTLFFLFYFKYFQSDHFSFLNVPDN